MSANEIMKRLRWVPAWGLSILASVLAAFLIATLRDIFDATTNYIIWALFLAIAAFLICILHPGKALIVPLLCNILSLLPAACDNTFWNTSFGLIIGAGIIFSYLMAYTGACIGKRFFKQNGNEKS